MVKSNLQIQKIKLFSCDLSGPVPVYTYHKTEIDDNSEVDDDFPLSVNAVKNMVNSDQPVPAFMDSRDFWSAAPRQRACF